jgi:hypothetical protein
LSHALAVEDEGLKTSLFKRGCLSCLSHGERLARMTKYVK